MYRCQELFRNIHSNITPGILPQSTGVSQSTSLAKFGNLRLVGHRYAASSNGHSPIVRELLARGVRGACFQSPSVQCVRARARVRARVRVPVPVPVPVRVRVQVRVRACAYACVRVRARVYVYVYACVRARALLCVCVRVRASSSECSVTVAPRVEYCTEP